MPPVASTDPIATPGTAFAREADRVKAGDSTPESSAADLVARLTDDELLWLLDGDARLMAGMRAAAKHYNEVPYEAGRIDRLGIPGIRFTDGPRGVVMGHSTAFPVAVSRAASYDPELERQIGDAIGVESRAQGANLFAGVCVNVPPFPGWGRSQEAYGEDSFLVGEMGSALVEGVTPWVMACVKHYALNSMEEARFSVDVRVDEEDLREAYLPHFRRTIESGADAVMSAYNSVNGEWAGQNRHLLTEILRDDWQFRGLVMTDFIWGLRDAVKSVGAGQDIEMPFRQQRARILPGALADGTLARSDVERAAGRIIASQLRLAARALPTPPRALVAGEKHRALARQAAARGAVLLRNSEIEGTPLLPLQADEVSSIAVLGRLADQPNLGDNGSSRVRPPVSVSILNGLQQRFGGRVHPVSAQEASSAQVASADVAVVVVGLGATDEGEAVVSVDPQAAAVFGGPFRWKWAQRVMSKVMNLSVSRSDFGGGDRRDLHLLPEDVALIERVASVNSRTIVILVGGSTLMLDPWDTKVAAILHAWYPGMEGGHAVADILCGDVEPGGRLPLAIPARRSDLPEVDWRARAVRYPRWFGQQKLDRDGVSAAYPLGFGLGYTTVATRNITVGAVEGERFSAVVELANTGTRDGRHVVQLYASQTEDETLPRRALVGFRSVEVTAGQTMRVEVTGSLRPMQRWHEGSMRVPVARLTIAASAYAGDPDSVEAPLPLLGRPDTRDE